MKNLLTLSVHPVISVLVILVMFIFFIRWFENGSIYFPEKSLEKLPPDANYKDIYVTASDGKKIHGWYFEKSPQAPVVLFFHGNGGNMSHRFVKIQKFLNINLNVLIFDYRGYGISKGKPSEKGLYKDADASYEWLLKNAGTDKIIFYGESLGSAVALELASKYKISAIILESPFTCIKDMVKTHYKFLYPFSFILKHKYDNYRKIAGIKSPILIIHSTDDEIVPVTMAQKLFDRANPPKQFLPLQGSHNDGFWVSERIYTEGIKNFLIKHGLVI